MRIAGIIAASLLGMLCGALYADTCWWLECDGDWWDDSCWVPHIPGTGDTVYIDEGCGGPAISSGAAHAGTLYVGLDTVGNTLQLGGGPAALSLTQLILAGAEGSEGTFTLFTGGQLSAGTIEIGYGGAGTFLHVRGTVNATSQVRVGHLLGSSGVYEIDAPSELNVATYFHLGRLGGTGMVRHNGGHVTCYNLRIEGADSSYELGAPGHIDVMNEARVRCPFGDAQLSLSGGTCNIVGTAHSALYLSPCGPYSATCIIEDGTLSVVYLGVGWSANSNCELSEGDGMALVIQSGGSVDAAHVSLGSHGTVDGVVTWWDGEYRLSGGELATGEVCVGSRGTGRILQSGGLHTVEGTLRVGGGDYCYAYHAPSFGYYELSTPGTLVVSGDEYIGSNEAMECSESRGDFVQSGGENSCVNLYIGNIRPGAYLQSGGTVDVTALVVVGNVPGSDGKYEMSYGELSTFRLWVGLHGNGEFFQSGGSVTCGSLDLGRMGGSWGLFKLSGGGTLAAAGQLTVGRSGDGWFTLSGGNVTANRLVVGRYSGAGHMKIVDEPSHVLVSEEFTLGANAQFEADPGAVVHLTHAADESSAAFFELRSTGEAQLIGLNQLELSFEGGDDVIATAEVGSADMGLVQAGFTGNFALGTLRVGTLDTPARVTLVDEQDNGNRGAGGEPEALYVSNLLVSVGSTLNVNGLHVYCRALDNDGTIVLGGGSVTQVVRLGDLNCDGLVNVFDIDPFVLALTSAFDELPFAGYLAAYPGCDPLLADTNSDGLVNVFDIDPFVQLLTGGG